MPKLTLGSAISPVLGLLGLDQQYNANQEANNEMKAQLAQQQAMEQAQMAAYNNYMSHVGQLQEQGAFNPNSRLQELNQLGNYDLSNALSSEAGAARALGYRPGDTVPIDEMNQTRGNYMLQQSQAANQILNQANANYLAALQGAPSLSELGSGIGTSSENARMFNSNEAGMGGMLDKLGQYSQGLFPAQGGHSPTVNIAGGNPVGNMNGITTMGGFDPHMGMLILPGLGADPSLQGISGSALYNGVAAPPVPSRPSVAAPTSAANPRLLAMQPLTDPTMSVTGATPQQPTSPYGIFGPPPKSPTNQPPANQPMVIPRLSQSAPNAPQPSTTGSFGDPIRPQYRMPNPVWNA